MRISIFQFSKEITKTYSIDLLIIDLGHNRNRITRTNRSQLAIYRNYMCWIYKIRAKMQNRYLDTISFTETHDELHGQTLARFRHRPLSPYLPPWFYYLKHIKWCHIKFIFHCYLLLVCNYIFTFTSSSFLFFQK